MIKAIEIIRGRAISVGLGRVYRIVDFIFKDGVWRYGDFDVSNFFQKIRYSIHRPPSFRITKVYPVIGLFHLSLQHFLSPPEGGLDLVTNRKGAI